MYYKAMTDLEKLANAPIEEVACGVMFEPIAALDPLVLGSYWKSTGYPGHEVRPVFPPPPAGVPLRALLVSRDEQYAIQLQSDRFYLNWRKRQDLYPRFTTRDQRTGLLALALDEFKRFSEFCRVEVGALPKPTGIELVKVDLLKEGGYWNGLKDLAEMLPWTRDFVTFSTSGSPSLALAFEEPRKGGVLRVSVVLGQEQKPGVSDGRVLRIESVMTLHGTVGSAVEMESTFHLANRELNAVFSTLIPQPERARRFGGGT